MSAQQIQTVSGYIIAVPRGSSEEESAKVALQGDDGVEYLIVPKGMGIDLMEHVNAKAEVTGLVDKKDELSFLFVRNYTVDDGFEDDWYDDKE